MNCLACQTPTRSQVDALTYNNNFTALPPDICQREPELYKFGFYRRLDDGRIAYFSICDKDIPVFVSMKYDEYDALLRQYIRKP
jgi:hypothetical protein